MASLQRGIDKALHNSDLDVKYEDPPQSLFDDILTHADIKTLTTINLPLWEKSG